MNKCPDSGTLLKDIDTILGELNALCAAHEARRATGLGPTRYEARPRIGFRPTAVKEVGAFKEKSVVLSVTEMNAQQPVTSLASLNAAVLTKVNATVELTVEYHTANGRFDARSAATDTVIQLWGRLAVEHGQCSHLVIRPNSADDKPLSRRLNALEMFYHSASAQLDTPQDDRQSGDVHRQTAGPKQALEKNDTADVLFSDDILPREDAATQASAFPVDTPNLPPSYRVLMMNSKDGAEYAWPVLCPSQWTSEYAMERAKAAVSVVKAEDQLAVLDGETGVSNYRHRLTDELCERGFIVPDTDEGPVWD